VRIYNFLTAYTASLVQIRNLKTYSETPYMEKLLVKYEILIMFSKLDKDGEVWNVRTENVTQHIIQNHNYNDKPKIKSAEFLYLIALMF